MEGYSPEPGEIIEENTPIIKRLNHKRRRSLDKKHKRDKGKQMRPHSKYSKSKSSSSITIKGSPKQKVQEPTQQETIIQEDVQNEPTFFELHKNKIELNDQLDERRKRIEAIRMKHQTQFIQKTPLTNEEVSSSNDLSSTNQQDIDVNINFSIRDNNHSPNSPNHKPQESFIKYIEQEKELLTKQQQGGNIYPPCDNHLDRNNILIDTQSPFTPDMFGDDPIPAQTIKTKPKDAPTINLSFYNQTESIGYYIPQLNEIIHSKYKVIGLCGKGVFSSVVKVLDIIKNIEYALKIIRNLDIMKTSGDKERSIITLLNNEDPEGINTIFRHCFKIDKAHIIRLKDSFEFNNHLCMIIDLYQMNLRDLIKASKEDEGGLPMNQLKSFAKQLIMGFILIHKNRLIHADCKPLLLLLTIIIVKPDNTVLDNSGNSLHICDFGSAFYEEEAVITSELVSRYYRAPEIILGMKPNQKIDIWSLGCTLFELYTGSILFPGKSNNEMIKLFVELKGKFSKKLMKRCTFWDDYFSTDGNYFKSKEYDTKINREYIKEIDINQFKQKDIMTLLKESNRGKKENDNKSIMNFANFLESCFAFDPFKRLSAIDAFTHPFLIISN